MTQAEFQIRGERLFRAHESLILRRNEPLPDSNGWFERYRYPVLTAAHTPAFWRYDLNPETNPLLLERLAINAAFNVGAMEWNGGVVLMHCIHAQSADLVAAVVPPLIEEGYNFVRLDQMQEYKQYETPQTAPVVAEAIPLRANAVVASNRVK